MRHHDGRGRPSGHARAAAGLPDQPRRSLLQGLERDRACSTTRERLLTPAGAHGPRRPHQPAARRRPGTRPSTWSSTPSAAPGSATAPTPSGCFGGGGLTNEKAYAVRQVRAGGAAHGDDRLQRPVLHVVGRDRGQPGLRHRPRAAVPARRHRRGRAVLLVGSQPRRHDAAGHAVLRRRPSRGRQAHRRRPAPHRHRGRRGAAPAAASPAPTSRWPTACCTSRSARAGSTTAYVAARTDGFDAVRAGGRRPYWPDRVERITGVPVADLARDRRGLAEAPSAMILTARGAEQHSRGTDTAQAFINLALALGLPGRPAPATARSPARATARAGASTARRPTSCPATASSTTRPTARTSPRSGASTPTSCRARGSPPSRCSTGWAPTAACGRCSSWRPTSSSRRPTPTGSPTG